MLFFASQLRHDRIRKKVVNRKCKPFSILKQRLQRTEITTVKKQPPQKLQLKYHAVSGVPILGHAKPSQSSKDFQPMFEVVVVLLVKGVPQTISILHPCEMYTTPEYEMPAGNVAKSYSL
ncbi:hypothetical protein WISP_113087 [Willisornis vidua]|uniref:Uncharacterized protein n=1 Tax=Willisornis vidua TaxID=1566151 RepID=A0ABQ9CUR8_9PASS|nr:hypothetical protein WISP_113087 [Willisornis vidua]